MFGLYGTIIVLILLGIMLFRAQEQNHRLETKKRMSNQEKLDQEIIRFAKSELLFKQHQQFISELFDQKDYYTNKEIIEELAIRFPHESKNYLDNLFSELCKSNIIGFGLFQINTSELHPNLYFKGDSFYNLVLSYPQLIKFLRSKADFERTQISYELHDKILIRRGNITSRIHTNPDKYFYFGVALGQDLMKEIHITEQHIFSNKFYIYTKPKGYFYLLNSDLDLEQYQQIYDKWLVETKSNMI